MLFLGKLVNIEISGVAIQCGAMPGARENTVFRAFSRPAAAALRSWARPSTRPRRIPVCTERAARVHPPAFWLLKIFLAQ